MPHSQSSVPEVPAVADGDPLRFLAAVDHEFRTAMNGVAAIAELLARQPLTPEGRSLVSALAGSAEAAQQLVADALELGRGDTAQSAAADDPFAPAELLDAVEIASAPAVADAAARLITSYDGDPDLRLTGDSAWLARALRAFVEHAAARSPGRVVEARLTVRTGPGGAEVSATVRDGGEAVAEDRLAYLFEPFETSAGGSPLRLPMARRMIQAMRGAVWAESNSGAGLTLGFDVLLPVAETETAAPEPAFAQAAPRVLIVDDNATNRLVATAFCEMAGCVCETAEDGIEAVEAVKRRAFDLVLMDIRMPRMDGVAATRAIRALPGPERDVPVLALTADADAEAARGYRAAGMLDVVEKPIKPERLLAALAAALTPSDSEAASAVAA